MIYDSAANAALYESVLPGLCKALNTAAAYPTEPYKTGRVVLDGDRLYMNVCTYETKPLSDASFMEAHRKFIDIMYMVEGEETIYILPTEKLKTISQAYDAADDALLAETEPDMTAIRLRAGQFVVLFPQDAHCPGCCVNVPENVRKIICKMAVD